MWINVALRLGNLDIQNVPLSINFLWKAPWVVKFHVNGLFNKKKRFLDLDIEAIKMSKYKHFLTLLRSGQYSEGLTDRR